MEIDKTKQQKELERVFLAPNLRPFLALTVKEDTDVEDEFETTSEDGKTKTKVQQTIHGKVFTTETVMEQDEEDYSLREEAKITYILKEGTKLIWAEGQGYVATRDSFQTLDELKEVLDIMKE